MGAFWQSLLLILLVLFCAILGFLAGFLTDRPRPRKTVESKNNPQLITRQEKNVFGLKDWEYRNFMRYDGTVNLEFDPENGDKE